MNYSLGDVQLKYASTAELDRLPIHLPLGPLGVQFVFNLWYLSKPTLQTQLLPELL